MILIDVQIKDEHKVDHLWQWCSLCKTREEAIADIKSYLMIYCLNNNIPLDSVFVNAETIQPK